MTNHISLNTDNTCMTLDCYFSGKPFMEVSVENPENRTTDNNYNGDYALIDLTLEQVKELHNYLTDVLKQAGEL